MDWTTYSVFVSSTFADMHSERDYLQMYVFPQLNEELKKYSISLRIVDLRWGINTQDQTQEEIESKVLKVCFHEIDRSRPFFIGLLGNRYGWIPPESPEYDLSKKGFPKGSSITSMEMEYCILRQKGLSGCVFMERETSCLESIPESIRGQYDDAYASDERIRNNNPEKLKQLKHKIKDYLHDEGKDDCYQIYYPKWNGSKFECLDDFGEKVKSAVLRELAIVSPLEKHQEPFQDELVRQNEFIYLKLAKYWDREIVTSTLIDKICSNNGLLTISGVSGFGKSCIYSKLVNYFIEKTDKYIVLYHTTSVGVDSRDVYLMIKRWNYQLETNLNLPHLEVIDGGDAIVYFSNLIKKIPKEKKLLLFLDSTNGFQKNQVSEYLSFYPRTKSLQWLMICTTLPDCVEKISCYHRSLVNYPIPSLDERDALKVIRNHIDYNSKELSPLIVSKLMSKQVDEKHFCYESPLWLTIALNRLLSLNEHDFKTISLSNIDFNQAFISYINSQIDSFPKEESFLFSSFIHSLCDVYGNLPAKLFDVLSISYNGLDEDVLADLMGDEWNALRFAIIRSFLYDYIAEQGNHRTWQIMHDKCRQSLNEDYVALICQQISNIYVTKLEKGNIVNDNIVYYVIKSKDDDIAIRYFDLFHKNNDRIKQELWQICEIINNDIIIHFLFRIYGLRNRRNILIPKSLLLWELREIVVSISHQFNIIGKHNDAIRIIDSFYSLINSINLFGDSKSLLFIMTEPERARGTESVCSVEEEAESYRRAISRASIRGPISLFVAPVARKYYKWQLFKLLKEQ